LKYKEQVEFRIRNHDNLYHLPNITPEILNLYAHLPFWSGIMCKSFKYEDNPPSSASIESQFNDLKNRVLKHVNSMPMRVDDFLKTHIESIHGTMKLVNATMISQKLKNDQTYYTNEKSQITNEKSPIRNTSLNNDLSTITKKHFEFQKITEDILCVIKNSKEITKEDSMESGMDNVKKQIECDRSTISVASFIDDAEDDIIDQSKRQKTKGVTQNIYSVPNLEDEEISEENWKNVQKSSRKRKSIYLTPNREILLRNIDSRAKTKVIGLIKNGSKSKFMSVKCNNGNYVLSNTCSFDTIVQMLAVAY